MFLHVVFLDLPADGRMDERIDCFGLGVPLSLVSLTVNTRCKPDIISILLDH